MFLTVLYIVQWLLKLLLKQTAKMEGGRWGIVIVISAFMIQVFAFGASSAIGVYNIELLDYFDNDTVGVALISAINWATFLGSGIVISYF